MVGIVAEKFDRLRTVMNEKLRRRWAACEAMAMQRGGIAAVSKATGMSPNTIRKGIREIEEEYNAALIDGTVGASFQVAGRRAAAGGGREVCVRVRET